MTPFTTVDVALIAAILGPAFSVITVIVTNWSLTRREQKRWQQEQAFEREKWERQHEEERQQDLQAKLLDTYSNCISALTAVTAIKAFDTSQEKWLSDLPKDLYTYFSELSNRRKETEKWLFLLIMYGFTEPNTEIYIDFSDSFRNFLSLEHPDIRFQTPQRDVNREIIKASAIIKEALSLRTIITGLAKQDQRLRTQPNNRSQNATLPLQAKKKAQ